MSKLVRHSGSRKVSSSQLLRRLSASPALPALIQRLQPHVLHELIVSVGLSDAGEVMALASASQLRAALDIAVWKSPQRGEAETFDPDQFVNWLETWLGIGEAFAAQRLCALGEDYLALAFAPLVNVQQTDMAGFAGASRWDSDDATPADADGDADGDSDEAEVAREVDEAMALAMEERFADFIVTAKLADEWDVVRRGLYALWGDEPDALLHMLRRLCERANPWLRRGDRERVLSEDVSLAREQAQEGRGFVTPAGARAFLLGLAQLGVAGCENAEAYDEETARYFIRMQFAAEGEAAAARAAADEADHKPSGDSAGDVDAAGRDRGDNDAGEAHAAAARTAQSEARAGGVGGVGEEEEHRQPEQDARNAQLAEAAASAHELAKLEALLVQAGIGTTDAQPSPKDLPRLTGATNRAPGLRESIEAMAQRDPEAAVLRMRELGYLANVLMKALRRDGVPCTEADAADAALATASLGLDWLRGRDASAAATALASAPGVVRLFGIGWNLVAGLPARLVTACESAFASEAISARLAKRSWLRAEAEAGMDELARQVRGQDFLAAREALTLLSLVFDVGACRELRAVLDELPRIVVTDSSVAGSSVTDSSVAGSNEATRGIAAVDDLRAIAALMQRLART